ncbi:MAG TPA: hypothetical protein VKB46_12155 [Pyrinomonadaceae bacterium]|nr:hypothetical protein [Pyrinomonadaceae bacterium]
MDYPATPYNEELIVRYLLGELDEKEQVEIEDHAFQDEQYMQSVLTVESDLIDEYIRGEIPADRINQFENHFLASAERRDKVEFARTLATVSAEQQVTQAAPIVRLAPPVRENALLAFIRSLNPVAAFSLAAAALILVFGMVWFAREGLRSRTQLAQQQAEQREREAQQRLEAERKRNEEIAAQQQREVKEGPTPPTPQPSPETPAPPTAVATLVLLPGLSRGSGGVPTLTVNPMIGTVRLLVGVDPQDDYPRFKVEVRNQNNKLVGGQNNLTLRKTKAGRTVVVDLPASKLTPGRYELALKGLNEGAVEDLGFYYFDVQKK